MSQFKIESGVPIPGKKSGNSKYPWQEMKVGDSFLLPIEELDTVRVAACAAAKRSGSGAKYAVRKVEGGARVWRVA